MPADGESDIAGFLSTLGYLCHRLRERKLAARHLIFLKVVFYGGLLQAAKSDLCSLCFRSSATV